MKTFRLGRWSVSAGWDDPPAPSELAHRVRVARIAHGWSQEALAREIGYSVRTVRRWEEGAQPRPRGVLALTEALPELATQRERVTA